MKIASIRCHLLSCPLPEPNRIQFPGGERVFIKRDALVIRASTDDGLVGYAPGPGKEWARNGIERVIAPFLEGRALGDPDALRVHFLEDPRRDARIVRLYCAVEIALFDLLGHARHVPVSEFLGGRVRDRIRIYGSAGRHTAPEHFAEEAYALSREGFRAYKMRAGLGPKRDAQAVELVRKSAGPGFDLMVDAKAWWRIGWGLYPERVVSDLISELGSYGIAWLEEPLPPGDHDAWRRLKELDIVPLAGGAYEPDELRLLDLIFNDGVDYVQMDIATQGGYWTTRRILPEVAHAGIRFAFAGCSTPLELAAALQLGVCWPEMVAEWLEYPCYALLGNRNVSAPGASPFPLGDELLEQPLEVADGHLIAPKGPGLGIAVDERTFERYPWIPGPASYFRLEESGGTAK